MSDPLEHLPRVREWTNDDGEVTVDCAEVVARMEAAEAVARLYQGEYYRLAEDCGEWNERHRIDAKATRIAQGGGDGCEEPGCHWGRVFVGDDYMECPRCQPHEDDDAQGGGDE